MITTFWSVRKKNSKFFNLLVLKLLDYIKLVKKLYSECIMYFRSGDSPWQRETFKRHAVTKRWEISASCCHLLYPQQYWWSNFKDNRHPDHSCSDNGHLLTNCRIANWKIVTKDNCHSDICPEQLPLEQLSPGLLPQLTTGTQTTAIRIILNERAVVNNNSQRLLCNVNDSHEGVKIFEKTFRLNFCTDEELDIHVSSTTFITCWKCTIAMLKTHCKVRALLYLLSAHCELTAVISPASPLLIKQIELSITCHHGKLYKPKTNDLWLHNLKAPIASHNF